MQIRTVCKLPFFFYSWLFNWSLFYSEKYIYYKDISHCRLLDHSFENTNRLTRHPLLNKRHQNSLLDCTISPAFSFPGRYVYILAGKYHLINQSQTPSPEDSLQPNNSVLPDHHGNISSLQDMTISVEKTTTIIYDHMPIDIVATTPTVLNGWSLEIYVCMKFTYSWSIGVIY